MVESISQMRIIVPRVMLESISQINTSVPCVMEDDRELELELES